MLKRILAFLNSQRSTRRTQEAPRQRLARTNQRSRRIRGHSCQQKNGGYSQGYVPTGHGGDPWEYDTIPIQLDLQPMKKHPVCHKKKSPHSTQLLRQSIATVFEEEQADRELSVNDHQVSSNTASPPPRRSFETVFEDMEQSSTYYQLGCMPREPDKTLVPDMNQQANSDVPPPALPPRPGTSTRLPQKLGRSSTALSRTDSIFDGEDDCSSAPSSPHKPTDEEQLINAIFAYGNQTFPQDWPDEPSREAIGLLKKWTKGDANAKSATYDSK